MPYFCKATPAPTCFFERQAVIGYIVEADNWAEERSDPIGESTNNRAEYHALIQGLELTSEKGCTDVEAKDDSVNRDF